jgi:phosphoserine phosphatase RsbU/P
MKSSQEYNFDWLIPYMQKETYEKGEYLFKKGDIAYKVYLLKTGSIRLPEIDVVIDKEVIIGEMGIFNPDKLRSASAVCDSDVEIYSMVKAALLELFEAKPRYFFSLIQLSFKRYSENLQAEMVMRERLANELKIAKKIQLDTLPQNFSSVGERGAYELFGLIEPAKEVGGDFYDFYFIDDERLFFMICDVSGKSVPAALFMMTIKTLFKTQVVCSSNPSEILRQVNNLIIPDNNNCMFATAFCGVLNVKTGEISYSNAGHNPPLICRDKERVEALGVGKSIVLGLFKDIEYPLLNLTLKRDDILLLYTDGVTEASDTEDNFYSEDRLKEQLFLNKSVGIQKLIQNIKKDMDSFVGTAAQFDDITLLGIK